MISAMNKNEVREEGRVNRPVVSDEVVRKVHSNEQKAPRREAAKPFRCLWEEHLGQRKQNG